MKRENHTSRATNNAFAQQQFDFLSSNPRRLKTLGAKTLKYKVFVLFFSLSGTASVGLIYFHRRLCSDIITDRISARTHWHCYCIGWLYNNATTVLLGSEVWESSNKESETQKKIHKRTRLPMLHILHWRWWRGLHGLKC